MGAALLARVLPLPDADGTGTAPPTPFEAVAAPEELDWTAISSSLEVAASSLVALFSHVAVACDFQTLTS